jgi:hypothetical protein
VPALPGCRHPRQVAFHGDGALASHQISVASSGQQIGAAGRFDFARSRSGVVATNAGSQAWVPIST